MRLRKGEKVIDLRRYQDIYEKLGCKLHDRIRVREDGEREWTEVGGQRIHVGKDCRLICMEVGETGERQR